MLFIALIYALVFSPGTAGRKPLAHYEQVAQNTIDKKLLLQLVNDARKKGCQCGNKYYPPVPPLAWNEQLESAASSHCIDMFKNNYFNHIEPNGSDAGSRIEKAGYQWKTYGENIGMGYKSEEEVVDSWLKSPGHCKNIMDKDFKDMGVARAGNYWTQDFGAGK